MYILSRLDGVPPESFQNQIRQLVIEQASALSSVAIAADNPCIRCTNTAWAWRSTSTCKRWTVSAVWPWS